MKVSIRAALLCVAMLTSIFAAPAGAQLSESFSGCALDGADDKCEAWFTIYDDDDVDPLASETPADVAVAPDGSAVYTAMRLTVGSGWDGRSRWAISAHDDSGERQWLSFWGDPGNHNFPTSIAASPDGSLVFVSGSWRANQLSPDGHLTTIALDARDGSLVWTANYDGPGGGTDNAREIVVSPDGGTLYIAGISAGAKGNSDLDYAAIAYDARSGQELWVARWDGIGNNHLDTPFAIDVSSDGAMVYLSGGSYGEGDYNNDYGTIAVATSGANAGSIVWSARYDGVGFRAQDHATALVVSPDDATVFVTGMSNDADSGPPFPSNQGYATVAYDAATGEQLWDARKQWPDTNFNSPNAMTIDPDGRRLVITGQAGSRQIDFGTVAYDPRTGQEMWSDRYDFRGYELELGRDITMDPRGDTVYVTGVSAKSPPGVPGLVLYAPNADQLTIAYDVMSGEKEWLARFNPSVTDFVSVQAMAVSPDATKIYTAASIDDQNWDADGDDYHSALIAYEIGAGIAIPPGPSKLELVSAAEGQYSDEATVTTRLTDEDGAPIAGADVRFDFQDGVTTATTDRDGVAAVTYTLTAVPGEYPLVVTYPGEEESRGPARLEQMFTISSEDTVVVLEISRDTNTLTATLSDEDSGAGVAGREILFYFNNQLLGQATTDEAGVAALHDTQAANRSDKHLRATFEGDDYYRASTS